MTKLRAFVVEHPLLAAGSAVVLGAIVGIGRPRGRIGGAIAGALGAAVIAVVRDFAIERVAGYARSWIDETQRQGADVSTRHEVDAFLEH